MPDRVVRDEILDSDRWLSLKRNTHRLAFLCLLLRCDALGNLEATDGQLWRLWREPLALQDRGAIPEILGALVEHDLIRIYEADAKRYAHIPRTKFRLRWLIRVCPLSPWTTAEQRRALEDTQTARLRGIETQTQQTVTENSPGARHVQAGLAPVREGRGGEGKYPIGTVSENTLRSVAPAKTARAARSDLRGTRLDPTAPLPDAWRDWAIECYPTLDARSVGGMWVEFRNYWADLPGQRGLKLRWLQTWQNNVHRKMKT